MFAAACVHGLEKAVLADPACALVDAHRDNPKFGLRVLTDEARDAGEQRARRTARSADGKLYLCAISRPGEGLSLPAFERNHCKHGSSARR